MQKSSPACGAPFIALVAIFDVALLCFAGLIYAKAPHIDDLYNVIYNGQRPAKPETSFIFIFGFPLMAVAASGLLLFQFFHRSGQPGNKREAALTLCGLVYFWWFVAALIRFHEVLALYG
jgi:hypothetical protein